MTAPIPVAESRGDLVRAVLRLGTPIIASNLLSWAIGFTDVLLISRLGEAPLAGLGMATQIFFLVVVTVLAVTTGTMVFTARAIGAGDHATASHVARQSLVLALALSAVMSACGLVATPYLLAVLGAEGAVADAGTLWLRVQFLGLAAVVLDFTISSILRGAGDSVTPLRVMGIVVVLNLALNYLLIFGPGPFPAWGIAGSAVATVAARGVGVWLGWRMLRGGRAGVHLQAGSWRPDVPLMRRMLRVGVPSAVEGFMRAGSSLAFLGIVARTAAGATAVAAHTVGLQIEAFARMPAFGIAMGATTLVGIRLGAGDPDAAERAGWTSVQVGALMMSAVGLLLFVTAHPMATLFTDDPATVDLTAQAIRILAVAQPLFLLSVVLAAALRGGGDSQFPMWVSFFSGWVFLLPLAWWLAVTRGMGPAAAWVALTGNYALSGLLQVWRFRQGRWRTMRV